MQQCCECLQPCHRLPRSAGLVIIPKLDSHFVELDLSGNSIVWYGLTPCSVECSACLRCQQSSFVCVQHHWSCQPDLVAEACSDFKSDYRASRLAWLAFAAAPAAPSKPFVYAARHQSDHAGQSEHLPVFKGSVHAALLSSRNILHFLPQANARNDQKSIISAFNQAF